MLMLSKYRAGVQCSQASEVSQGGSDMRAGPQLGHTASLTWCMPNKKKTTQRNIFTFCLFFFSDETKLLDALSTQMLSSNTIL